MSAKDTEYLTSNRRIRFPFADDSTLPCASELESTVFGCFVDAMVQLKPDRDPFTVKITGISISGHTIAFTLKDDTWGMPSVRITCTRTTEDFPVIRGENEWCWYVFVMSSAGIREYEEKSSQIGDISSASLDLHIRCLMMPPMEVNRIHVLGGLGGPDESSRYTVAEAISHESELLQSGDAFIVSGDVRIRPGNNMEFGSGESKWGIPQSVPGLVLNAVPGAGDGTVGCGCEDTDTSFRTPGLAGADGHSRMFNDTCYDLVPAIYSDGTSRRGELRFNVKCKACCTCEMYAKIVNERLIPLKDRILESKASIDDTLEYYEEYADRWNTRIATCLPEDVVITSTAVPLDAAATDLGTMAVTGKMNRCGFNLTMRNDSFVQIRIELDKFVANGVPFEAQLSYMQDPNTPKVLPLDLETLASPIFVLTLSPGRSAQLSYFLRLENMVTTDHQTGFSSRLKISAYQGENLIVTREERISV